MYVEDIALETGTILYNRYILEEVYYVGQASIVYLSKDVNENKRVVVKEYCPYKLANRDLDGKTVVCKNSRKQQYIEAYRAFQQEIKIVQDIKCTDKCCEKNVLQYIDSFSENETLYLVTEYVEGTSFDECIENKKTYSMKKSMLALIHTVRQIHEMGILHRDIKPSNIIIKPDGDITLIDFGSACYIGSENNIQFVSRGYSAPELYTGNISSYQTDIYSIGALLYYILTGYQLPAANEIEEGEKIPYISEFTDVSEVLESAIMQTLEQEPEKRIKDLSQLEIILMT